MATQENWITLFEKVIGRQPDQNEIALGLDSGFAPSKIKAIAAMTDNDVISEEMVFESFGVAESDFSDSSLSSDLENSQGLEDEQFYDVYEESPEQVPYQAAAMEESVDPEKSVSVYDVAEGPMAIDPNPMEMTNSGHEALVSNPQSNDFQMISKGNPEKSDKQIWVEAFERYLGRKPNPDEFIIGKNQDFDLTSINLFLKNAKKVPKATSSVKRDKKTTLIYALIGALCIGGLAYYMTYQKFFSRQAVMDKYISLATQDGKKAMEYQVWSDTYKSIKSSELKYTDMDAIYYPKTSSKLWGNDGMRKVGQKYLIFPDWKVLIHPVNATVNSNTKGLDLEVNGKKWTKTDSNTFSKKLMHLYPGDYDFKASGKVNNQDISISNQESLEDSKKVNLNVSYLSFTVKSNIQDGELYMGSSKLGKLTNGEASISKAAVNKSSTLYVKKSFKDGSSVKSNTQKVSTLMDGDTVTLDSDSVLTRDTADSLLEAAYGMLQSYSYDNTNPNGLDSIFVNGNKNNFYADVVNMIDTNTINAKNRSADSISFSEVDVNNVVQTGARTYTADFTVLYDFYYGYDSKHRSSGDIKQKMSWSVIIEYKPGSNNEDYYGGYSNFMISGKNGESKALSTENTVE